MGELHFEIQNIIAGQGLGLAIAGMSVVFISLALISLCIALLPRLLHWSHFLFPPEPPPASTAPPPPVGAPQDEEILAAIGFALHVHARERLWSGPPAP